MGLFDGTTKTTNTRRRHTADAQHLDITINRDDESAAKQSSREIKTNQQSIRTTKPEMK